MVVGLVDGGVGWMGLLGGWIGVCGCCGFCIEVITEDINDYTFINENSKVLFCTCMVGWLGVCGCVGWLGGGGCG